MNMDSLDVMKGFAEQSVPWETRYPFILPPIHWITTFVSRKWERLAESERGSTVLRDGVEKLLVRSYM